MDAYRRVWLKTMCRSVSMNIHRAVDLYRGSILSSLESPGNVRYIDGQSVMQTFLLWSGAPVAWNLDAQNKTHGSARLIRLNSRLFDFRQKWSCARGWRCYRLSG